MAWYPNLDGAGDFGEQEIISDLEDGATSVVAVDVDDNDMDVISGALDMIRLRFSLIQVTAAVLKNR